MASPTFTDRASTNALAHKLHVGDGVNDTVRANGAAATSSSPSHIPTGSRGASRAIDNTDDAAGGTHCCVLLEKYESNAYPLDLPNSYPLMFVHATRPIRIAVPTRDNVRPPYGSTMIERIGDRYTIWEILIKPERLVDFHDIAKMDGETLVNKIVSLIIKYKVVYFSNLPINYYSVFKNVSHRWSFEICRHSGVRQSL